MEKIGSILNKVVVKAKSNSINIEGIFTPQERKQITGFFQKKDVLFVSLKGSPQVVEFNLKRGYFLKKAQAKGIKVNKIIFQVS